MNCACILLGIGCLVMIVYEIEAFCLENNFKNSTGPTCKIPDGPVIYVGESYTSLTECLKYDCETDALWACGVGSSDPEPKRITGCVKQNLENCCYRFVKRDDNSSICQEETCPVAQKVEVEPVLGL